MIALEDLDTVLEYLDEGRYSVAKLFLLNVIKAERDSRDSRGYDESE
jgi:hypothetical protein